MVYELNFNKAVNNNIKNKQSTMIEGEFNSKLKHLEKNHKCVEIKLELKYMGLGLGEINSTLRKY